MRRQDMIREISGALQKHGAYIIDDENLRRIWPDPRYRYIEVKDFVTANGWRLFAYGDGRGAMVIPKGRTAPNLRLKLDLDWWCGSESAPGFTDQGGRTDSKSSRQKPRLADARNRR